jgi:hypothetical protein
MTQFSDWQVGKGTKNAIINGDMRVAQRGASFAAIADATYNLDRWRYYKSGSMVHTVSRDTSTVPSSQFYASMKFDVTTADASIAATDYCMVEQRIEGYNFNKFRDQTATLSFWVRAGKTGTMCVAVRSGGADRSYVTEHTINATNTWEKKEVQIPFGDVTGGTWSAVNNTGVQVDFMLAAGSNLQTTPDAWQTGSYYATSNQTNFCDNTDSTCDVWITGVQLELGSQATDFEFLDFEKQMALCERYLQTNYDHGDTPGDGNGPNYSTIYRMFVAWTASAGNVLPIAFRVRMRTSPSVTLYRPNGLAGTNGRWQYYKGSWIVFNSNGAVTCETGFNINVQSGAVTIGDSHAASGCWVADAEL